MEAPLYWGQQCAELKENVFQSLVIGVSQGYVSIAQW